MKAGFETLVRFALFAVLVGLSGCAPRGVPSGASRHFDSLEGGVYWTWVQKFDHGCAAWMATRDWADVQLLVDSKCEGKRKDGYVPGRGLAYFTSGDELTFQGYWPWSEDIYFPLLVFDEKGMVSSIKPCPRSLSLAQIDEMKVVGREAYAAARTGAERRVFARIRQRLAAMDGAALGSSQGGCTDTQVDIHVPLRTVDVWESR